MRRMFILLTLLFIGSYTYAQTTEDLAIELSATVQTAPAQIKLQWKIITVDTPNYYIYKKAKTAISWGSPIATIPATDSVYTDTAVVVDSAYEYKVWGLGTLLNSYGYIYAGITNPPVHNKGTLLMIVDTTFLDSCDAAINTMMQDISGDGWQIIRHNVGRSVPDTVVKAIIANDYTVNTNVISVLLLGHIAVPYSGNFDTAVNPPDGHVPYHDGAWPADIYYSCMTGWTDVSVTNTGGSYAANYNVPGDGKWDQIEIPSAAVLEVSRIDFYNMPSFGTTEVQMMNSYLARDHSYKMDSLAIRHRGLISDNFGYFSGEGFAANGWRNFAPLVGRDSLTVTASGYISSLADSSFQWAYACGGGTFTSASGVGATTDFAANPINGIFTMMFGSYFGDWNVSDNFLRAPLCSSTPALTDCWAGRPNWFFHHMALGENIGYGALLTQNNGLSGTAYDAPGYGSGWIHVALMGDLTLRIDYIKPPSNLAITTVPFNGATLTWTASPDAAVIGYYVYRADSAFGYFQRISGILTTTTFHDSAGTDGLKYYMVRPAKLQSTPSGSYNNLGVGITDTASVIFPALQVADIVAPGINLSVFPNPAQNYLNAAIHSDVNCVATLFITDEAGEKFNNATKQLAAGDNTFSLRINNLPPGVYTINVQAGATMLVTKWVKL